MFDLSSLSESAAKCSHCNFCQAVCPSFLASTVETISARARVNLIKDCLIDGKLKPGKRFHEIINSCLLCGTCTRTCPISIPTDELVAAARHKLHPSGKGNPFMRRLKRGFEQSLGEYAPFSLALKAGRLAGQVPPGVPTPAPKPLMKLLDKAAKVKGKRRGRVLYFVGCATNAFYPQTALDTIKVFAANGIEAVAARGAVCCGIPALADGDLVAVKAHIEHNLAVLDHSGFDAVITDCTSCANTLKTRFDKFFQEGEDLHTKATLLKLKTFEAGEYLLKVGLTATPRENKISVTYHIPCHGAASPATAESPRAILRLIPGVELREMKYPDRCCGGAGAFHLENPEISRAILFQKTADALSTHAQILTTPCPSCRSFLEPALPSMPVRHPMSILADCLD